MIGTSWQDDPQKVLMYRINELCIGDKTSFRGVGVRRIGRNLYAVKTVWNKELIRGKDYTFDLVWLLTQARETAL